MDKKTIEKLIITPVDGSSVSLKSLSYLHLMYGSASDLEIRLLYVLPTLPSLFDDDPDLKLKTAARLKEIEAGSLKMGEEILAKAKKKLIDKGFPKERIKTVQHKKKVGVARDICHYSHKEKADAVLISTHGRSRLEAFYLGEVANNVLEYGGHVPVWLINGNIKDNKVLIGIDRSENALCAVDHAGLMLPGTGCEVTLFHSKRNLRRFIPRDVLAAAPELESLWQKKAGEEIMPYMEKAKEKLRKSGLPEDHIKVKIIKGSRSAASDIVKEARSGGYGTVVLGRRGESDKKEYPLGSVVCKIVRVNKNLAIWVK